jgi:thiosulfate/3-mercaptopyruvate sulfurtransferase
MAGMDEVQAGPPCLLNALAPDVFSGETNRYGRAGRIPGSVNVYAKELVDPDSGRLLPREALRERLGAVGALNGDRVVAYCGAGVSATLDAFALTLLGAQDVAIYDGSMSEWVADPARSLETGS